MLGAALLVAALVLVPGCGKGLFDRSFGADTSDATVADGPDTGAAAGPDAAPDAGRDTGAATGSDADAVPSVDADPNGNTTTEGTFDDTGGFLNLWEAHVTIGSGTFSAGSSVTVTLSRISTIGHDGAVGPVFEISVPQAGLLRQDATLTIDISPPVATEVGANLPALVLGTLDPNASAANQQWVPVSASTFDPGTPSVTGPITGFGNAAFLQFAAVIKCPPITTCPSGQNCSAGGACNQCPTGSPCP